MCNSVMDDVRGQETRKAELAPSIWRFFLAYAVLGTCADLLLFFVKPDGKVSLGIVFGALFGAAVYVGEKFVRQYDRGFEPVERWRMTFYSSLLVVVVSLILNIVFMVILALVQHISFASVAMNFVAMFTVFFSDFSFGTQLLLGGLGLVLQFVILYVTYGPVVDHIKERQDEFG